MDISALEVKPALRDSAFGRPQLPPARLKGSSPTTQTTLMVHVPPLTMQEETPSLVVHLKKTRTIEENGGKEQQKNGSWRKARSLVNREEEGRARGGGESFTLREMRESVASIKQESDTNDHRK